ncbi:hypothetical protein, partial [Paenibacillus sp. Soil787]|uniref:hypothetical protein n=1 Tax=Paenibacillus sp. Soil787 TaxID=1736411 RepID=UPI000AA9C851
MKEALPYELASDRGRSDDLEHNFCALASGGDRSDDLEHNFYTKMWFNDGFARFWHKKTHPPKISFENFL